MTTSDFLALTYDHRDVAWIVAALLGWSARPPRWLVWLRRLPLAGIASVLEWTAQGLRFISGEVSSKHQAEAPSSPHPEVAGNTEPKGNP